MVNRSLCGLDAFLMPSFKNIKTKILIYKMFIRPVLTYASKIWTFIEKSESSFPAFERKILRIIFRAVNIRKLRNFEKLCNFERK